MTNRLRGPGPRGQWEGGAARTPRVISARGQRKVKVGRLPRVQPPGSPASMSEPISRIDGMLRAPEPQPGEAGVATQAKPLTSFLIQDILRDGTERRGGHTGSPQPGPPPLPPHQQAAKRQPELEPQGGRGGAGAQEDQLSPRPGAAPGEAESPTETEPGKPARPRRPGWVGWGPEEDELACRLSRREGGSQAHLPALPGGCCRDPGLAVTGEGTSLLLLRVPFRDQP